MKMIQKNGYWLILLFFFLTYTMESAFAQKTNVDDMESLSRFMDSIVEKRFYKNKKTLPRNQVPSERLKGYQLGMVQLDL